MVSMTKSRVEIMNEYSDAKTIQEDEVNAIIKQITENVESMEIRDFGMTIGNESDKYTIHYLFAGEQKDALTNGKDLIATFSYFFIELDGNKFEVETDGRFQVQIPGAANFINLP
jgi:DNA integrity scanning protein DisA with diadenylate cyclase activity